MPTICLNMIVKNEAHVMARCLTDVKHLIDYWVIVDTGSTDGTQEVIKELLQSIPGELHERPWVNFGHNRTEALNLARGKADYIFVNDADEVVEAPTGFIWPDLTADGYYINAIHGNTRFARLALIASRSRSRYQGVLHEYVEFDAPYQTGNLTELIIRIYSDGGRSQHIDVKEKYAKDAVILEQALLDEPNNARYVFYLAQSYRDSEQWQKSLEAYQKRVALGGWDEEIWYSLFEIANNSHRLSLPWPVVIERYLTAYQYRPKRAETLVELARYCRGQSQNALAHLFSQQAIKIAKPDDLLFVNNAVYDWLALDEYAIACYWINEYAECERACRELLANPKLPSSEHARILSNLNWALQQQGLPPNQAAIKLTPLAPTALCPICQTPSIGRYLDSPYWQCATCDTWFQHPMPDKVFHGDHEPPPAEMPEQEQNINRALARWLFSHVMQSVAGPIIDIGAKLPVMAQELQNLGCPALAMDGAPGAEPLGSSLGVQMLGADFEAFDDKNYQGHFKLITLIHTFEHFYDPIAALLKLRRLIAYNGALFIRLPDHGVAGFQRDLTPGHYTIHPYFHSLTSIKHILSAAGAPFQIVETYPVEPGQRDIILKPAYQPPLKLSDEPVNTSAHRPIIGLNRPGAIGDILMTLNFIPLLKKQHPNHLIYYFCHPSYAKSDALGGLFQGAGVDKVLDAAEFQQWQPRLSHAINLIGYPLAEGYPDKPMQKHLLEYFASEMGLVCASLPSLCLALPPKPVDAPNQAYATLQLSAGWSKYKEWPEQRWQEVEAAVPFPIVRIGQEYGRDLAHSIALIAHAKIHLGIDSFANHLTHYYWQDNANQIRRVSGVIIFGSTQASASGYAHNINLTTDLPCQPCFRENPSLSAHPKGPCINPPRASYDDDLLPQCLASISSQEVITAIHKLWQEA